MSTTSGESELFELHAFAVGLARSVGAVLIKMGESEKRRAELRSSAETKTSRTDLASDADRASEALIAEAIRRERPLDGLVSEEGSEQESRSGVTWIVDPLDGTTNYLYGIGSFAVSIAASIDDDIVAGVVFDPSRDELFSAVKGSGATVNDRLLLVSDERVPLSQALIGTGFGYRREDRKSQANLLPTVLPAVRDLRRSGSAALDLCFVAAGRLDGYYEKGLKSWDSAAGVLICSEARCPSSTLEDPPGDGVTLIVARPALLSDLVSLLVKAQRATE